MTSSTSCATLDAPAAAVDLGHLRRYTMGNRELEREVLGLFAEQAAANLEMLRHTNSPKAWREVSHTLKGAALGIGAWQVAQCCQEVEASQLCDTSRAGLIPKLDRAVRDAIAFIARL